MVEKSYEWWQKTVVYQVYPLSFKDSTGNGIGDLAGIIEKLDYLKELGVETIWFSPFFESPQQDHGYDVTNYRKIDQVYGSMSDFDKLVKEIHDRNMKIVLDLVLNHTSNKHPWFLESASSKDNPKRDWYIWRDGKKPGGKKPPNNWKSLIGGSAWRYYKNTDQWVYFHFLPFQPDLNYRNSEVKEEMFDIMRFWLDKGVDGFRLDILYMIYEDKMLRNNPFTWNLTLPDNKPASFFQYHKYDVNRPETFEFTIELRKLMEEYEPERLLVGEIFGPIEYLRKYYGPNNNGLHMVFLFEFTSIPFNAKKYRKIISRIEKALAVPYTPTYVFGNHDRDRYISRLKDDPYKAKILTTMQLTLRGVPYIYYGEEIGMSDVKFSLKTSEDPLGRRFSKFPFPQAGKLLRFSLTRDRCRTPMQWNKEPNAGFSSNPNAKTWLKVSDNYKEINVAKEERDPSSLLNCYKRLLKVRRENIALQEGIFEFIELGKLNKKCLAYKRIHDTQEIFIYLNFSNKEILLKTPVQKPKLVFSTLSNRKALNPNAYDGNIKLLPLEGIIFR
ncbi:MAG: alpha-glucosidase [Promethearchaeota archaeon]|nr:MAG: alpha-glucosidase [Candidatus Lokiarchaeota archaeon]